MRADRVSLGPLQEAFQASGMTYAEVAIAMNWIQKSNGRPDGSRVSRTLGFKKMGDEGYRTSISYDNAVKMTRALGLDPVDTGV